MSLRNAVAFSVTVGCLPLACGAITIDGVPLDAPRQMVATDGRTWDGVDRDAQGDTARTAVLASAAHDIPCPLATVAIVDVLDSDTTSYVTEGCGSRLTYAEREKPVILPSGAPRWRITYLLIGRVALGGTM